MHICHHQNRMRVTVVPWFTTTGVPRVKSETGPHIGRVRRDLNKRKANSRMAGGGFNKQGNLHRRLVLGGHKMSRFPHPPARILKVHIEA